MMKKLLFGLFLGVMAVGSQSLSLGQKGPEQASVPEVSPLPQPGHSTHGEVFNEGPRQKAYLMDGMAKIHFPVTSQNPDVQKFVEQGISQLHGYWYFEAERSFRQAAKLDPECAIAYWGMAMANEENLKRVQGFLKEAVKRKAGASKREKLYIEALDEYLNGNGTVGGKKEQKIVNAFAAIAKEFPDDLEALAFEASYLHRFRGNLKKSYEDVDALIKKILEKEPLHPVHHYMIHLWDYKTPKNALSSAAQCGPSAPGIAHMWHMPGHIYSDLKRYEDAVWQQEASSRVDHKYMIKNLVLPDQIHNYAHNQEWLIRNLTYIGRYKDALTLAKNLIEIPRHPKYNPPGGRKSTFYGRLHLMSVLTRFELWDETIALANTPYLEPTSDPAEQVRRLRQLGIAYVRTKKTKEAEKILAELQQRLGKDLEYTGPVSVAKQGKAPDQPAVKGGAAAIEGEAKGVIEDDWTGPGLKEPPGLKSPGKSKGMNKKPVPPAKMPILQAIQAIQGHQAYMVADYPTALDLMKKGREDDFLIARVQCLAGDTKGAIAAAQGQVKSNDKQVLPLAALVEIYWNADQKKEAVETFEKLRELSGPIQLGAPVFDALGPIARELKLPEDWRVATKPAADLCPRPKLSTLGPFAWMPGVAPKWSLHDLAGHSVGSDQYKGKPVIMVFYLGYGCIHCAKQLEALAAKAPQFEKAGVALVGISTDDDAGIKATLKGCKDGKFAFPLLANPKMDVFKTYRAFDDFEDMPLHATVLIDGAGLVRWIDINYEPFMDVNFLLTESQRLLSFVDTCCE